MSCDSQKCRQDTLPLRGTQPICDHPSSAGLLYELCFRCQSAAFSPKHQAPTQNSEDTGSLTRRPVRGSMTQMCGSWCLQPKDDSQLLAYTSGSASRDSGTRIDDSGKTGHPRSICHPAACEANLPAMLRVHGASSRFRTRRETNR